MPMVCVSMLRAGGDEMKAMLTAALPEGSYDPSAEAAEILYSLPEQLREPMTAGLREPVQRIPDAGHDGRPDGR